MKILGSLPITSYNSIISNSFFCFFYMSLCVEYVCECVSSLCENACKSKCGSPRSLLVVFLTFLSLLSQDLSTEPKPSLPSQFAQGIPSLCFLHAGITSGLPCSPDFFFFFFCLWRRRFLGFMLCSKTFNHWTLSYQVLNLIFLKKMLTIFEANLGI